MTNVVEFCLGLSLHSFANFSGKEKCSVCISEHDECSVFAPIGFILLIAAMWVICRHVRQRANDGGFVPERPQLVSTRAGISNPYELESGSVDGKSDVLNRALAARRLLIFVPIFEQNRS